MAMLASTLDAASMRIYTEFRRIDPFGKVVAADAGGSPREVISPVAARNGYASFLIAVQAKPGSEYELHLGQNPAEAVELSLYRVLYAKQGEAWIPDQLEPVRDPHGFRLEGIEGQTTMLYWLDVWVPARLKPGRFRVEAQLLADGYWVIAPMEVRVQAALFPKSDPPKLALPEIDAPADQSAFGPWRLALCGEKRSGLRETSMARSIRYMIQRNAQQDVDLAREMGVLEAQPKEALCGGVRPVTDRGTEWYLQLRNGLVAR